MAYNKLSYTGVQVAPCEEPPESCLHSGLEWDEGNLGHCKRLTPEQIEVGLGGGYLVYDDPLECRYRILFRLTPPDRREQPRAASVFRLIISTAQGRMRPVSVMVETSAAMKAEFFEALEAGEME